MAGVVLRRWRIGLSAAVGACYAVLLFLPGMAWLGLWPCKILSGIVMPLIAYGGERSLLRVTVLFFGASAALAGLVMAVEMLGGAGLTLENGVLYSVFDLRLLLLLLVVCYFAMSLFFRRIGLHSGRELIAIEIVIGEKTVPLTALIDTGHSLTDPATNRPIVVVEACCFKDVLPADIDLNDPIEGLKCLRRSGIKGVQLVPYRAVGVECGMLVALRACSVIAAGKSLGNLLVAMSPTPVDDGGGYQALIGGI